MKKLLVLSLVGLAIFISSNVFAFELSFRNGPTFKVKNWIDTQYKLGLNFASSSKGANSGFMSSTTIDLSVLQGTTILWLTPEFQYDIKLGGIPLYLYPKFGLDLLFGWYPGNFKAFGFGIKAAFGAKFDLGESIFIWAEPLGLNMVFAQYSWGGIAIPGVPSIALGGWDTSVAMSYDMMFGIGFRL